jgi:4-carboxymuconolactone decarboxylase
MSDDTFRQPTTGSISVDVAARHAHVIGHGPRIEAIPNDEIDEEAWNIVHAIRDSVGASRATVMPEYMRLVLKHREIFRCHMEMGTVIFSGQLPARERELAVLRIGYLTRAPYEWGEHVDIGKRYGLSAEEVVRVTQGSSAEGWAPHDAAILRGVEELLADQAVSDATYETLAASWTEAQIIEYLVMVGQYIATACLQNSLRVRLAGDNPGLSHR